MKGDTKSPLLLSKKMISKQNIKNTAEKFIAETPERFNNKDIFIVEVKVSADNKINILIDAIEGVTIDDCVGLSRAVEKTYDREEQDYELTVSSYGIDKPLILKKQYQKNINKKLKIETKEGQKITGTLTQVNETSIVIEETKKKKVKESNKKQLITEKYDILYENIHKAKLIITF